MKRLILPGLLALVLLASGLAPQPTEARDRVVHRSTRTVVRVHTGFPIRRTLPQVVIRSPHVALRVSPRIYLPPVPFGARYIHTPPRRDAILWEGSEVLNRNDGWTEVFLDVDHRGKALLLDISGSPAQLSFAEVVFENGETRVVDFADRQQKMGLYPLLDFRDGRKVDHVRLVARARGRESQIALRMIA